MKLLAVIQAADGRVSGGDPYLWECYGPNAHYMEFRDDQGQGYSHCVFDTKTYDVYEIHAEVPQKDIAYRWVHPKFLNKMVSEAKRRRVNPDLAWDEVVYNEVDDYFIMLQHVKNIGTTKEVA